MKINNNGQALIEFILVMPVFLILILALIDFGNILYKRYQLENDLDYIVDLYNQDLDGKISSYVASKDLTFNKASEDNTTKIIVTKGLNIITPGLKKILNSPYEIKVERVIYDE